MSIWYLNMDKQHLSFAVLLLMIIVLVCYYLWKVLNFAWFKPKKLEKLMRKQGYNGNPYRVLIGDAMEIRRTMKEAKSKSINPLSNDIVPRVMPFIHQSIQNYGKNCLLWFGPVPTILALDPNVIKEMLAKNYTFHKLSGSPLARKLGKGLSLYQNDKWAKHRRLLDPAFRLEKLKNMIPSFYLSCDEMLSQWDNIVPTQGFCEFDVLPYLKTMTSDAISRTAFGSSYIEGRRIFQLQSELVDILLHQASPVFYIPGSRFWPTKMNRRIKEITEEVNSSVLDIVNRRKAAIEAGEVTNDDLLGLLLESNNNEIQQNGSKSGMSMEEVVAECKLFYLAGEETTSALLVWTLYLLARHKDWQVRAREEVLQVFGNGMPGTQELNQLKIVTMIIYEVLRLYPSASMLTRVATEEMRVGGLIIPAGLQLMLPIVLLHQDSEIWGDDAKEFKPERFSEGVAKACKSPLTYLPFGWGPRRCIGQNFAMFEAKVALGMMLRSYSFELSPSYSHSPLIGLSLQPQHGAHLMLQKLQH